MPTNADISEDMPTNADYQNTSISTNQSTSTNTKGNKNTTPYNKGVSITPAPVRDEFLETFGVLKNVKMKAAEYRHLVEDYGEDITKDTVDDLSCKLADGNAESQNHYATILSWLRYQRRNDTGSVPMSSQTDKAVERAKELKRMWEHCSEQDRQEHLEANNNVFPWDDPKYNEYLKP